MTKLTQEKAESLKEKPATGKGMEVPVPPGAPSSTRFLPGAERLQGRFLIRSPPRHRKDKTLTMSLHVKEKPLILRSHKNNIFISIKPSFTYIKHPTLQQLKIEDYTKRIMCHSKVGFIS